MIFDNIDSALIYAGLGEKIAIGLALLNEDSVRNAAPGRHEVDGENLFYVVDEYETKPGEECIGVAPLEGLTEETHYDGKKDLAFYKYEPTMSNLHLQQGMFAIFWPNEPHMPCRSIDKAETVKKIVVKIRME